MNRKMLQRTLHRMGRSCALAEDGRVGVDWVLEHGRGCRLILVDRSMPVMDGLEALRLIKEVRALVVARSGSEYAFRSLSLTFDVVVSICWRNCQACSCANLNRHRVCATTRAYRYVGNVSRSKAFPNVPIVGLTGDAQPHEVASFIAAGAEAVLTKPVDKEELAATLQKLSLIHI